MRYIKTALYLPRFVRLVQKVDKELQKGWNIFACNLLLAKITSAVLENCVGVSYRFKALSQFNANHA